jgi:aminoacyl tRNA synthase complex-interacting multifunctional protein 1
MDSAGYYAVPAVTRYFNHIQHLQPIFEARTLLCDTSYTLVEFDLDNMPSLPRKVEVKEKKVKKGANSKEGEAPTGSTGEAAAKAQKIVKKQDAPSDVPAASVSETVSATQTQQPKQKKDKKEKVAPNTEQKKSKNASSTEVTGPMPSMIDLRVGKVLEGS